jgi:lipoprotein-anchoring transpeptidase ErfK/SrfK
MSTFKITRRFFVIGAAAAVAGCNSDGTGSSYSGAATGTQAIDPVYYRQRVAKPANLPGRPGTLVVDTAHRFLYAVEADNQATRYGVGVGREGFLWSGSAVVGRKAEWPTWTPPPAMLIRDPNSRPYANGMPGGPDNPLGARALYLYQGSADTLYRIHGTNEPWTIGQAVSSGCIRMMNEDVIDLYNRTPVGTPVIVLDRTRAAKIA